jgi:hypothetical protein
VEEGEENERRARRRERERERGAGSDKQFRLTKTTKKNQTIHAHLVYVCERE